MNDTNLGPLPPELDAFLSADRVLPEPPASAEMRVFGQVRRTLGIVGGFGGDSGQGGSGSDVTAHQPIARHLSVSNTPSAGSFAASLATRAALRPFLVSAVSFVAGGAVGAGTHALAVRPPVALVAQAAPPPRPTFAPVVSRDPMGPPDDASVVTTAPSERPTASTAAPRPTTLPSAPSALPGRDVDLASERTLLDVARTALGRGQSTEAVTALERHARDFPRGRLAEERDALWVQALVTAGHTADARTRAEAFRRSHPRSLLLPAVDAAVGDE